MTDHRPARLDVQIDGHQARLAWIGTTDPDFPGIVQDFLACHSAALEAAGVTRLYALVDVDDSWGLRALHRNGFLREGRHSGYADQSNGSGRDVYSYARPLVAESERSHFSYVMNSVLPTHRVIAHVLIRDEQGRILYEKVRYKQDWELPGGVVEPNEPPRIGAQRELAEELGVDMTIGKALVIDWMPPYLGWGDAIEFIFDGGVIDSASIDDFQLDADELDSVHWVAVDDIGNHVTELSARRIQAILKSDGFYYSEDGLPVIFD